MLALRSKVPFQFERCPSGDCGFKGGQGKSNLSFVWRQGMDAMEQSSDRSLQTRIVREYVRVEAHPDLVHL